MQITFKDVRLLANEGARVTLDFPTLKYNQLHGLDKLYIYEPDNGRERPLTDREADDLQDALAVFNNALVARALANLILSSGEASGPAEVY
jgi:hypothetical protein